MGDNKDNFQDSDFERKPQDDSNALGQTDSGEEPQVTLPEDKGIVTDTAVDVIVLHAGETASSDSDGHKEENHDAPELKEYFEELEDVDESVGKKESLKDKFGNRRKKLKNVRTKIAQGHLEGLKENVSSAIGSRKAGIDKRISKKQQAIAESIEDVNDLRKEVIATKKDSRLMLAMSSIKVKLVGAFLIPVILIIILGVLSFTTASNAIISSFEKSAQSTIQKTGDYYDLMFSNVKSIANDWANNLTLQEYYSGTYSSDMVNEGSVYTKLKADMSSTVISNKSIANAYIIASYGKDIYTSTTKLTGSEYTKFKESDEAKAVDAKRSVWVTKHPYLDGGNSSSYRVSFGRQVVANSKKGVGYMFYDIGTEYVTNPMMDIDIGNKSIIGLITPDGGEIITSNYIQIEEGTTYFTDKDFFQRILESDQDAGFEYVKYNGKKQLFLYSRTSDNFIVTALVPESIITAQAGRIKTITISTVIFAILVAIAIGGVMATSMSTTIHNIMNKLEQAAGGDLTVRVRVRRKDEFKVLGDSINNMVDKMKSLIEQTKVVSSKVDDSALTVTGSSKELLEATKEITMAIEGIEKGIIQQAGDAENCMKQMDELSDKINIVSMNSEKIADIAEGTKEIVITGLGTIDKLNSNANDTAKITKDVISGIETLEKSSKLIGNIIGAINEIADQTNLLSLNASIEAARAGDAGRGFAVVAGEIRKLADQSVQSVNEIRKIVEEINLRTRETVNIAKRAEGIVEIQGDSLKDTMSVFNDIREQVNELINNLANITSGVEEITSSKSTTLGAIESISAVSQETAASAEEITGTAEKQMQEVEELNRAAEALNNNSRELAEAIDIFKV